MNEAIEVDCSRINTMLKRLLETEVDNNRTREKNDAEMVRFIQKMIEEEAQCL